jgi:hypothetical protein
METRAWYNFSGTGLKKFLNAFLEDFSSRS